MKQTQILDCNRPITGRRIRLERLGPQHVDLLLASFSNQKFWSAYRANQNRAISRNELLKQLQFEYENIPSHAKKIEWIITKLPVKSESNNASYEEFESSRTLGLAALSAFNVERSEAEFMISFFKSDDIKAGLALESSLLIMDVAFNQECLARLISYVYSENRLAQRSTMSLGFKNEGILKSHYQSAEGSSRITDVFVNKQSSNDFRQNCRLRRLSQYLLGRDVTAGSDASHVDGFRLDATFKIE